MILKHHVKSLARKLLETKSRGERLRVLEEEERRVLRELKREAIEEVLELTAGRVLGPRRQRKKRGSLPGSAAVALLDRSPGCDAMTTTCATW